MGIASADTSKDSYLELIISRATWWIEYATGRKFGGGTMGGLKARKYNNGGSTHGTTGVSDEDYVYFDGTTRDRGGDTINSPRQYGEFQLPAYPVQANAVLTFALAVLSSRSASGGEVWDTSSYAENDQYIVDRQNGILRLLTGPFVSGIRNYRVTMAAGYQYGAAQPYVPPDLEGLCIEIAKGIFRDNRDLTSESIGTWSRSFDKQGKDPYVEQVLARYTRTVL